MQAIARALIRASHGHHSSDTARTDYAAHLIALNNPPPCSSYYSPSLRNTAARRYLADKLRSKPQRRHASAYGIAAGVALLALGAIVITVADTAAGLCFAGAGLIIFAYASDIYITASHARCYIP